MISAPPFDWIEHLFRSLRAADKAPRFQAIHEADEMLLHASERAQGDEDRAHLEYWASGFQVAATLDQLVTWRFGGWSGLSSFLDFGGGFGRVTRHVVERLEPDKVTVAEVLPTAVEFQERAFGVRGVTSASSPDEVQLQTHGLVYAGSLFTHLPHASFGTWLAKLLAAVEEGGLLVFSVHDLALMPEQRRSAAGSTELESGLLFHPSSESRTLDHAEYGSTWVTEGYVADLLRKLAPEVRGVRLPRGLCNYQDLWVVARGGVDPGEVPLDSGPQGALELCSLEDATLRLAGWALDRSHGMDASSIEVMIDGQVVGESGSLYPRPDLLENLGDVGLPARDEPLDSYLAAGWEVQVPIERMRRGSTLLTVVAHSTGGMAVPIFAGALESALFLTSRENHHRKVDEVQALKTEIDAMKQSWFWRQRDRWFALKRSLGLTKQP